MRRALALATRGGSAARPNPRVGCVILDAATEAVVAEGWHHAYGAPHAEAEAVSAMPPGRSLADCKVFVTLEPCAHYGKRPPCADLLVRLGATDVVVATLDPFPQVAGQGVARLRAAGCRVRVGLLETEARWLNRRFLSRHERGRPWVVLKWAESADGYLSGPGGSPTAITGEATRRLVHRWRTEEAAILVGAGTALADNPRLDVRHWPGPAPQRIVLAGDRALPAQLHFGQASTGQAPALVLPGHPSVADVLATLQTQNLESVLVEGGGAVLRAFLAAQLWDEIRVLRHPRLLLGDGLPAPRVPTGASRRTSYSVSGDQVTEWLPPART